MAAYDPKRPRPSASTPADDPAPVEALLDRAEPNVPAESVTPPVSITPPESVTPPESDAPVESDPVEPARDEPRPTARDDELSGESGPAAGIAINGTAPGGSRSPHTPSEVPVAPAPETGTANRAVLIAAVVSSTLALVLVVLLARRRRRQS